MALIVLCPGTAQGVGSASAIILTPPYSGALGVTSLQTSSYGCANLTIPTVPYIHGKAGTARLNESASARGCKSGGGGASASETIADFVPFKFVNGTHSVQLTWHVFVHAWLKSWDPSGLCGGGWCPDNGDFDVIPSVKIWDQSNYSMVAQGWPTVGNWTSGWVCLTLACWVPSSHFNKTENLTVGVTASFVGNHSYSIEAILYCDLQTFASTRHVIISGGLSLARSPFGAKLTWIQIS